ncbi:serine hydrolase domain-containing protein [Bradyrhizobium elkanii]|uniref:serine hydrolase domain-containing protein n=1 Tax=Bradyrhizobium elkanii TaxID=29448 RepID=UPI00155A0EAF|nr:serine hydrolase domain-containing protein [Bradyrhizobium elkanii]MCP1927768.1 CubicO group peptidase (beta-lactamase class C family) [Bradyrhizobium elkanii]MCS3581623.1 CubicO group peptidase (beta-lactamase class C family) [Bradyrhizobium elkanii]MCS3724497.1 CubicO group peptidase (beta-lactamase class C family) [Bradyrhizobium elkanii]MCS4008909.1 CubicO group peptidase (beta-lactamase class C family) [Bradyrhizobium elkanii USDA 61]
MAIPDARVAPAARVLPHVLVSVELNPGGSATIKANAKTLVTPTGSADGGQPRGKIVKANLLKKSDPASLGFDPSRLQCAQGLLEQHVSENKYEGCQIAVARHGSIVLDKTYGTCPDISKRGAPKDDTLFRMRSITKTFTAAVIWSLVEEGKLSFFDHVIDYIPEFAANGKEGVTLYHLMTHQAGFPNVDVTKHGWADHKKMREEICAYLLEFAPGTRIAYHRFSAHWVLAAIIEQVTGKDFRDVMRERIFVPLGIEDEMFVGLPDQEHDRVAREHSPPGRLGVPIDFITLENTAEWYRSGHPAGGGVATARSLVTFFQMLGNGGEIGGKRLFSRRMIEYVTRVHTGDRLNELVHDNIPEVASYGLGVFVRGKQLDMRTYGSLASPTTFANGAGLNGIAWSDPETGVSLAYLNNSYFPTKRWIYGEMEKLSNIVYSAVL